MKTTTKKRPSAAKRSTSTARRVRSYKAADDKPPCRVDVHPTHADFYFAGDRVPSSRLTNGAPGSDAAARVASTVATLANAFTVTRRTFDAQGNEVTK